MDARPRVGMAIQVMHRTKTALAQISEFKSTLFIFDCMPVGWIQVPDQRNKAGKRDTVWLKFAMSLR